MGKCYNKEKEVCLSRKIPPIIIVHLTKQLRDERRAMGQGKWNSRVGTYIALVSRAHRASLDEDDSGQSQGHPTMAWQDRSSTGL